MDFRGTDPSGCMGTDTRQLTPFLDQEYFRFCYGDPAVDERIIDAQYASSSCLPSCLWSVFGTSSQRGLKFALVKDD